MSTTTIGEVARLAGITVRALHHYDEIGLLTPSERRDNGYRGYSEDDITRLQYILAYRELGLGLHAIAGILDERLETIEALRSVHHRVQEQIKRLERISKRLGETVEATKRGTHMTPEEKLDVFGTFNPDDHAAETEERWGHTDSYSESMLRTESYTPEDWKRQSEEGRGISEALLVLMSEGVTCDSEQASHLVDAHRAHISRWFYECTPEMHAALGTMYVDDERFRSNIDEAGEGLAGYLSAAISARYAN